MTERKPPGMPHETWVDRQIREAQERGEFDDLPSKGKPLPDLDRPRDEMWWVKQLVRRENLSLTPETIALRREVERTLDRIDGMRSERAVRRLVDELNERIREVNARPATGPPSDVAPLDPDEVVRRWRDHVRRQGDGSTGN
ncbi:DUF1992 domain-containing protein [Egibacter rhizosphaerae]|uniref:DUF1992 domain-containing protein n=1 Tax=Egibacter rhizosphaerae TaxID=1670831 RepID=A0A411YE04_9ACTN|nr:DUF1992 domain-containing protein [Egibacter rhizosphaerae]QBI19474.1 DUF1992 domain-containing protein [Egibacter rhizosphaerae]